MKVAVITPYYKETDATLKRCISSVASQTLACQHYLIADGPGCNWLDTSAPSVSKHLRLHHAHGDFGNTPRGIGALLAVADGADAVCFLDADNMLDHDHVEVCCALAASKPAPDYVVARRRIVLPDGTAVPGSDEPIERLVDTNCFFLLKGAFHAIPQWVLQPKPLARIGDRVFLKLLQRLGLSFRVMSEPTVTYISDWEFHYRAAGQNPPSNAKYTVNIREIHDWWHLQSESRAPDYTPKAKSSRI